MNEKHVQQVLEIEKEARAAYEAAVNEAKELPLKAEQEAQLTVEKARAEAEAQAHQMIQAAQSEEQIAQTMVQAEEKVRRAESTASSNFDRAVADILRRVVGKE